MNLVNEWHLFDNSSGAYEPIASKENKEKIIFNLEAWQKMKTLLKIYEQEYGIHQPEN